MYEESVFNVCVKVRIAYRSFKRNNVCGKRSHVESLVEAAYALNDNAGVFS